MALSLPTLAPRLSVVSALVMYVEPLIYAVTTGTNKIQTPENIALSALSRKLAATGQGIRSYIDWHSYSQLILTPWGWSCDPEDLPATLPRMREVGQGVAAAIFENSGMTYEVGPACEILYFSTGTGRDYHHGVLNATHSWTLELRPASASQGGFVLPPEQILSTVQEQWAGQQYLLREVWND